MTDTSAPILELRNITKSFGSVQALTEVDFEVRRGEVMALVGDNGAGKSTLVKCVAGTHAADSGEILFEGDQVSIHGPKDAARLGIEVVYQDLALCDNLDVVQNMYLGREVNRWQILNEAAMEQKTAETLKSLAVTTIGSIRRPVATLSGGQRQSVAVTKAVQWNSKLVILDEPTAALGVAQTEQVLALVRRLGEQGLAVVIISHNLHDIFETADRITVLRLGRNVGVFERATTSQQEVVAAITAGVPTKVSGIPATTAPEARRERRRGGRTRTGVAGIRGAAGRACRPLEREYPVREPRDLPDRRRADLHRHLLRLHGDELLHGRQLRQRDHPDGRHDDARLRRRLRAAARGDRPFDRLRRGHRCAHCGGAPAAGQRAPAERPDRDRDRDRSSAP